MPEYLNTQLVELLDSGLHYHRSSYQNKNGAVFRRNVRRRCHRWMATETHTEQQTTGEVRLRQFIRKLYAGYKFKGNTTLRPEKFQLEMLKLVIPTLAKNIVGEAWSSIGSRLCREFGWSMKRHPKLFLGQAPRRFGKTVIIAMIMLTYAIVKPGAVISTFSTSRRTSQRLKLKVQEIMQASGMDEWIVVQREEEIFIRPPEFHGESWSAMNFYPSNPTI